LAQISLSGIYRFPVKSLGGGSLERAWLDPRGIRHDRHWMVVDATGQFLTQRDLPRMALISARLDGARLILEAPDTAPLVLPIDPPGAPVREVQVWGDRLEAAVYGRAAREWLSAFLDTACELVFMPEHSHRPVDPAFATAADEAAFSDGFPLLLISEASLEDLNARLDRPLPMIRFRPNLVVRGCPPYAEDQWRRIRIGGIGFRVVKPCSRCVIPGIDPLTAEKGVEPLRTLAEYRRRGNKVYFGQNLLHDQQGELKVGDRLEVLE